MEGGATCWMFQSSRRSLNGMAESGTLAKESLRTGTWVRHLNRLGEKAGFQQPFSQCSLRRGLSNVVNIPESLSSPKEIKLLPSIFIKTGIRSSSILEKRVYVSKKE